MRLVKEFVCDNRTPSDEEIRECLEVVETDSCVVKLIWFFPYNGRHELYIKRV